LMGEQKDIGKLKENNDKLKMEMQSLKAMLAAQAKEGATSLAHTKEMESKQAEITMLEKRVAELEKQLAAEKSVIEKLEADMHTQNQRSLEPGSPRSPRGQHRKTSSGHRISPAIAPSYAPDTDMSHLAIPSLPSNYVSPELVAQHKSNVAKLEDELKAERKLRRQADGEVIKLRAAINGVELGAEDIDALLATKLETTPKRAEKPRYVSRGWFLPFILFYSRGASQDRIRRSEMAGGRRATIRSMLYVLLALAMDLLLAALIVQRRSSALVSQHALHFIREYGNDGIMGLTLENETDTSQRVNVFEVTMIDFV
jgi:HPt (histidine-containing phosphotransfer) domain-containing protein